MDRFGWWVNNTVWVQVPSRTCSHRSCFQRWLRRHGRSQKHALVLQQVFVSQVWFRQHSSGHRHMLPTSIMQSNAACGSSLFYRLLPHQRVMLIPPTYNVTCCASTLFSDVDSCLLKQMRLYPTLSPHSPLSPRSHLYTLLSLTETQLPRLGRWWFACCRQACCPPP